jgi:hypothetical protein
VLRALFFAKGQPCPRDTEIEVEIERHSSKDRVYAVRWRKIIMLRTTTDRQCLAYRHAAAAPNK